MPPKNTSATGRQSATKNPPRGVQKNRKLAATKSITRSQVLYSSDPPVIIPITPEPLQESSAASPNLNDSPGPRGRKRRNDSEVERPGKRLQDNRQFSSESSQPLTKENLATLGRLTGSNPADKMDHTTTTLEKSGRKRIVSRQSSTADLSQVTTSAETVVSTHARYRRVDLHKAGISVRSEPLPKDVESRINVVIQRETAAERKEEVIAIAKHLCNEFVAVLNAARREDDSVEPLHRALSSMDKNAKFEFSRKIRIIPPFFPTAPVSFAHIVLDWDTSLKPELIQIPWNFSFLERSNDNVDESIDSPSKRRQPDSTCDSPERPQRTMPPPSPLQQPRKGKSIVKTPRPDITIGLRHSIVVKSLKAQGLDEVDADLFLRYMQEQQTLCSDPSQQATLMRFPLLVVEGKSYSTGKFVFEAQNQAAVSGSCMMKMQHQLDKLTELSAPESYENKEPLAFSICTEGPHMELWAHYTTSQDGLRNYNMRILQTCHASLLNGVVDFLLVVDRVLSWGCSDFLDNVTKQLAIVEGAARQHAA
ncbi:hypothetical protein MMC18_008238 [Xylographa bjoerkii]|nr:hypothetical protein [Xylographa bjoerkii]